MKDRVDAERDPRDGVATPGRFPPARHPPKQRAPCLRRFLARWRQPAPVSPGPPLPPCPLPRALAALRRTRHRRHRPARARGAEARDAECGSGPAAIRGPRAAGRRAPASGGRSWARGVRSPNWPRSAGRYRRGGRRRAGCGGPRRAPAAASLPGAGSGTPWPAYRFVRTMRPSVPRPGRARAPLSRCPSSASRLPALPSLLDLTAFRAAPATRPLDGAASPRHDGSGRRRGG